MKKTITVIGSIMLLISCSSKSPEVEAAEKKKQAISDLVACMEKKVKLMESGLAEEQACVETDRQDKNCHCLDSFNVRKVKAAAMADSIEKAIQNSLK